MVPSVYFCSVCTHRVSICKYHLPLICCWMPCIHPVWGNEIGTHVKNQPAKLPLDGDHIHAAFPSSSRRHVPMSFLCPLLPTSLSANRVSIWSFSLHPFHWDSLYSPWLLALLSSLSPMWQDSEWSGGLYLPNPGRVSGTLPIQELFSATSTTLRSMWLSWSPALITGLMNRDILERWS